MLFKEIMVKQLRNSINNFDFTFILQNIAEFIKKLYFSYSVYINTQKCNGCTNTHQRVWKNCKNTRRREWKIIKARVKELISRQNKKGAKELNSHLYFLECTFLIPCTPSIHKNTIKSFKTIFSNSSLYIEF